MATATSRRAGPSPAVLKQRRKIALDLLDLHSALADKFAQMARLEAELKTVATAAGESFKEDFGERGYVSASGRIEAECKGELPVIQSEAWLALKELDRKRLIKTGLVKGSRNNGAKPLTAASHPSRCCDDQTKQRSHRPFVSERMGICFYYPGDPSAPIEETINCRCYKEFSVDYLAGVE